MYDLLIATMQAEIMEKERERERQTGRQTDRQTEILRYRDTET